MKRKQAVQKPAMTEKKCALVLPAPADRKADKTVPLTGVAVLLTARRK